jgi:hypothetical protein
LLSQNGKAGRPHSVKVGARIHRGEPLCRQQMRKDKHRSAFRRITSDNFADVYLLLKCPAENVADAYLLLKCPAGNVAGVFLSNHSIINMLSQGDIATLGRHKPIPVVLPRYRCFIGSHGHVPGIPYLTYHLPRVRHVCNACRAHMFEQP